MTWANKFTWNLSKLINPHKIIVIVGESKN